MFLDLDRPLFLLASLTISESLILTISFETNIKTSLSHFDILSEFLWTELCSYLSIELLDLAHGNCVGSQIMAEYYEGIWQSTNRLSLSNTFILSCFMLKNIKYPGERSSKIWGRHFNCALIGEVLVIKREYVCASCWQLAVWHHNSMLSSCYNRKHFHCHYTTVPACNHNSGKRKKSSSISG